MTDELGNTIADARRLAERAKAVFVHYRIDREREWRTGCIRISKKQFVDSILSKEADEPIVCRLYEPGGDCWKGQLWLQVG